MAYTYDRPDLPALAELERILTSLTEELAAWRRRTLKAEAELKEAVWWRAPSSRNRASG